ncbi:MAG: glycosyltransferase [Bacteroidetes bacterium]|nr:glycosyltransferase [Bacteroidota bacterium]
MNTKIILTVPVYNEEKILESSINTLHTYLSKNISFDWNIIIADNASTDNTKTIAERLSNKNDFVKSVHLKYKGRGNALKYVWTKFDADIYAYCDVDLATNISHLKTLFDNVVKGDNIVIASRYLKKSNSNRTIKRFALSKGYIYLIKLFFKTNITDFQCGFKAIDKKVVQEILPKIKDKEWFFDTELLILAEQSNKYKIKEIPVEWHEKEDSKVRILKTVWNYIVKLIKLRIRL